MQHTDLCAWIALQRTPGISHKTLSKLILHGHKPWRNTLTAEQIIALELSRDAAEALACGPDQRTLDRARRDTERIEQLGIRVLGVSDADYPPLLKLTADPPPLLYVQGDAAVLSRPQVAIVGSRRCSRQGSENARHIALGLVRAGLVVTSGCALGIDAVAHRGALSGDGGCSVGVLGTGVDVIYPRRNRDLFEQLPLRGALVSEFPLGTQPQRALFPQRNRLISGLSLGVLVVEAALQSGSLITARFAVEQNRDVFAIPGSIHSASSAGCHALIQQGAQLVTATADILEALSLCLPLEQRELIDVDLPTVSTDIPAPADPAERRLLKLMGFERLAFDELCAIGDYHAAELQALLTGLELRGMIESLEGGYQRLQTSLSE